MSCRQDKLSFQTSSFLHTHTTGAETVWEKLELITVHQSPASTQISLPVPYFLAPGQKCLSMQNRCSLHLLISLWTSARIFSSSLEVSYSFSMSYSCQGCAHFWACSICSGVRARSKRMPWMLNMGRSHRLDQGFGHIFTFNW